MGYQANFSGWQHITLEDLVVAYRKAKVAQNAGHKKEIRLSRFLKVSGSRKEERNYRRNED